MSIDIKNYEDLITCEESLIGAITELALITSEETNSINEVQDLLKSIPYLLRKINTPEDQIHQKHIDIMTNVLYGVINEEINQNSTSQSPAYA